MKAKEWRRLSRLLQTQAGLYYGLHNGMNTPSGVHTGSLLMALSVIAGQMADREKAKPDTLDSERIKYLTGGIGIRHP